jgi:hypothetical protein
LFIVGEGFTIASMMPTIKGVIFFFSAWEMDWLGLARNYCISATKVGAMDALKVLTGMKWHIVIQWG